jgi:hypothetical protein
MDTEAASLLPVHQVATGYFRPCCLEHDELLGLPTLSVAQQHYCDALFVLIGVTYPHGLRASRADGVLG